MPSMRLLHEAEKVLDPLACLSSHNLLIVTLPPQARTSRRRIAALISRELKVGKCWRDKKSNRFILIEVATAAEARRFCLQKNGQLQLTVGTARLDTAHTVGKKWTFVEGPSPQRIHSRPPKVSVPELRSISCQFDYFPCQQALPCRSEGLGLAPPYHLLPDTPYFRTATIIPPPYYSNDGQPILQRTINRYLASIQLGDDKDEMALFDLTWEKHCEEFFN